MRKDFKFTLSKERFDEEPRLKVDHKTIFTAHLMDNGYRYKITWKFLGVFKLRNLIPYYDYEVEKFIKEGFWIVKEG